MFKWLCFGTTLVLAGVITWMVNDIRVSTKQTLEKARVTAEIAADVSQDIKGLRKLAGIGGGGTDKGFTEYANEVMDLFDGAGKDAKIGVLKKGALKDPVPADEWTHGERKKALVLVWSAKSKADILKGICHNIWGSEFGIQIGNAPPVSLEEWIKSRHPASKELKLK